MRRRPATFATLTGQRAVGALGRVIVTFLGRVRCVKLAGRPSWLNMMKPNAMTKPLHAAIQAPFNLARLTSAERGIRALGADPICGWRRRLLLANRHQANYIALAPKL